MTAKRDLDLIVSAWLDEGPVDLPDATRRAVLTSLPTIRQARRGHLAPWRFLDMNGNGRLAGVALVAVIAIGAATAFAILNRTPGVGPPGPTATPSLPPSPSQLDIGLGTVTLTAAGCTWDGNPSIITVATEPFIGRITVVNETDTFANFGIYRLADGRTWEEAESWITDVNEELHGGPIASTPAGEFNTEVGNIDAPARRQYESTLVLNAGTHGIVCSSNEPPPGLVFAAYLVGPLEIAGE